MSGAKYTEYLSDYLEEHELPAIFDEIDGFEDLFVATYCDREIGLETEALFEIKLEAKANNVIPLYKQRLTAYNGALATAQEAKRVITESITGGYTDTIDFGAQKQKATDLPLDYSTLTNPSSVTESDAYQNGNEREETRELTREESGETTLEAYDVVSRLQGEIYNIMRLLLKEFEVLFMGIF